ncbi:MAG: T9SS type A sorting domain-containing protein [Bacteroidales bacterium]|nr:T9SS type A sorting domain-containing protein [Bacteroidales bacterium]
MKYKKQMIAILVALFTTIGALNAQQKYALIIGGDYKPGTEIPDNHKWNNGQNMDPQKGWDEFWNDSYLMWELLYDDPITGYSNDNIEVLFAEGIDYSITFSQVDNRYKSYPNFGLDHITDAAATKANVISELNDLVNIKEEDYLFIWIMSNGGNTGTSSYVYLWDYDPGNPDDGILYDTELKAKLDLIPAHKKVVVVQAPNSGGFASELADDNTIVITSSQTDEQSSRANDTPYEENEWWGGIQYHHGEFGYHFYSPLNGEDPGLGDTYGSTSFETWTNANEDDVIDFEEADNWLSFFENAGETPQVSGITALGPYTSVQYSTLLFGSINSDQDFMGTIGLTGPPPNPNPPPYQGPTAVVIYQGNVNFDNANMYFLDDTRLYNDYFNSGLLWIGDNVTLYGFNTASGLVSYSEIEFGADVTFTGINGERWGGLAVQNPPLYFNRTSFIDCMAILNTIPSLEFKNCVFERAGLLGDYLYGHTHIHDNTNFFNSYADLDASGRENSLLIENSHFDGPSFDNTQKGIYLLDFVDYSISSNIIQDYAKGLYLFRCSGSHDKRDIYGNSIHGNYSAGISIYSSYADIFDNPGIYENGVGIQCDNRSNVEIEGNEEAVHTSETQRIHDNTENQIRAGEFSFPYMKWNAIWYDYNTEPLVYWEMEGNPPPEDISNNFWGAKDYFDPNEDFYPTELFVWDPVWKLQYGLPPMAGDEFLYESAATKSEAGDFTGAKNEYMQLVSDYTDSRFAEAALKELFQLEYDVTNDYASLQQYYLTDPDITGNEKLDALAVNLANWCNVEMEDYTSAIQYYNDILTNPPSYHDSVYAIIDIDYIYYLMNNNGYKSSFSDHSSIFDMSAKEQHDEFIDSYTSLLYPQKDLSEEMKNNIERLGSGELIQNFPNPFSSHTDIWFKIDKPANVTLNIFDYSGKLISTINEGEVSGGNHNVTFDKKDLSPGLYFYTLVTDGIISDTKKMTVMK